MRYVKGALVLTVFVLIVAMLGWAAAGCADQICAGPSAPQSCQG
jgi:hypothetical protein